MLVWFSLFFLNHSFNETAAEKNDNQNCEGRDACTSIDSEVMLMVAEAMLFDPMHAGLRSLGFIPN